MQLEERNFRFRLGDGSDHRDEYLTFWNLGGQISDCGIMYNGLESRLYEFLGATRRAFFLSTEVGVRRWLKTEQAELGKHHHSDHT